MSNSIRDVQIVEKIVKYCIEVEETINLFGDSYENMIKISAYKNAIAMCVLQIGELSGHLSEEFKALHNTIPWKQIKAMRNFMAHRYGHLDTEELWNTAKVDIPVLRNYCEDVVSE